MADSFREATRKIREQTKLRRSTESSIEHDELMERGGTKEAVDTLWLTDIDRQAPDPNYPPTAFSRYAEGFVWASPWEPFIVDSTRSDSIIWKRKAMRP